MDDAAANNAISDLNGKDLNGRPLRINEARERTTTRQDRHRFYKQRSPWGVASHGDLFCLQADTVTEAAGLLVLLLARHSPRSIRCCRDGTRADLTGANSVRRGGQALLHCNRAGVRDSMPNVRCYCYVLGLILLSDECESTGLICPGRTVKTSKLSASAVGPMRALRDCGGRDECIGDWRDGCGRWGSHYEPARPRRQVALHEPLRQQAQISAGRGRALRRRSREAGLSVYGLRWLTFFFY